jgi:hypothetical protein
VNNITVAIRWAATLLLLLACPVGKSQTLNPHKPGLWQIDMLTTIGGMKASRRDSVCITAALANQDLLPTPPLVEEGWNCLTALVNASARQVNYTVSCRKGAEVAPGTGELQIHGSTEFHGTLQMAAPDRGDRVNIKTSLQARWIKADCGSTPPPKW